MISLKYKLATALGMSIAHYLIRNPYTVWRFSFPITPGSFIKFAMYIFPVLGWPISDVGVVAEHTLQRVGRR